MSLDLSRLERVRPSGGKTIARCPACAETGNDSAADHLFINSDGKFGCVLYQSTEGTEHRKRIFELVGNAEPSRAAEKSVWTALPSAPASAPFPSLKHWKHGQPSAHWVYKTEGGQIAGIVARFETATGKETWPYSWCRDQHGNTGWQWKAMPEPRPLYALPLVEDFVVITEGEKCAEAVIAAKLPATTWPGGCGAVAKAYWEPLRGKVAVIWPDNDEPGRKALAELVGILTGIAAEIKVVQIPADKPPKWDAADTDAGEIFRLVDEAVAITPAEAKGPVPFRFSRADEMGGVSEAMDFVEGLLTEGGASVIYGPSNCGKSFWTVDLGVCVATGAAFRDELEVEQGAVVYIALEGAHGAKNRIEALKQAGRLKPGAPFYLIFESVSLLETGHSARLAETVAKIGEDAGMPVALVILDTMARAMAGGDENSGQDMTAAVKSIDAVRAATGAHVAVVHHCGKDEARGARGHSSLRAAVDTEIEVSRAEGETISTVRVTKQRDLQAGEAMPFSLKVIELGTDRRGKPITSCIVHHEDSMMARHTGKKGRPQTTNVPHMLSMLPQPSTTAWEKVARHDHEVTSTPFFNALREIKRTKAATFTKKGGWVVANPNFGSEFA